MDLTPATSAELQETLSRLAHDYGIPGMAVGAAAGDSVIWSWGFGAANVAAGTTATPSTPFHLASLTKTFASAVVLRLVEAGQVQLDDKVRRYGVTLPDTNVTVRHLITHTSDGVPGTQFRYNGNRYALLSNVIQSASGKSFETLAREWIVEPLALTSTVPGDPQSATAAGYNAGPILNRLAQGYDAATLRPIAYPQSVTAAAGLVSSVDDMLRYGNAWMAAQITSRSSVDSAFTANRVANGAATPYGLGWFVSSYHGERVVWHYGLWIGNSSLIMLVPQRHLTIVVLANSDGLSQRFNLGAGDLLSSPFASALLSWAFTIR
jgi:CubicO group peptidase (beta-lactamase class C family)